MGTRPEHRTPGRTPDRTAGRAAGRTARPTAALNSTIRGLALRLALVASIAAPAVAHARADAPPTQPATAKSAPAPAPAPTPATRPTAAAPAAAAALHEPLERFPQSALGVRSGDRVHRFRVWIADTDPRREQGLMWLRTLPPDRGMLFVFGEPRLASFWMKNTYVPLDILFVAPDGRVIRIAENALPQSLDTIDSMGYVTGVLELPGGTAKRLGLRPGDAVLHPAFARR